MKKRRITVLALCAILSMTTLLTSVNIIEAKAANKTMKNVQDDMKVYLEQNHPEIKIGTPEYVEYLAEQLVSEPDNALRTRADYEDICTYAARYLIRVNEKQIIFSDESKILNLTEKELQETLQEIREQVENEEETEKLSNSRTSVAAQNYTASSAVAYARKWAKSRNSAYASYSSDCTNFVSQALAAGGIVMKKPSTISHGIYNTTSYWYSIKHQFTGTTGVLITYEYDVSSSWINVSDLYTYAKNNGATIITCSSLSSLQSTAKPGDVVQLKNSGGWYHSIIITGGSSGSRTYCAHTTDRLDQPVSSISGATSFRIIRY